MSQDLSLVSLVIKGLDFDPTAYGEFDEAGVQDAVDLCAYVSQRTGVELTIEEGGRIFAAYQQHLNKTHEHIPTPTRGT